jgi:NAD(P)-dependent dehydrogenase (short-subunit alcohol dehydrogenase family)
MSSTMPMTKDVLRPGHTAVVTGASSGIGRAACAHFACKAGMHVYMVDIDEAELQQAHEYVAKMAAAAAEKQSDNDNDTQQQHQQQQQQLIRFKVVDVANQQAMQDLAEQVYAETGHCHLLMNNAGIGLGGGALTDMTTVEHVMRVNVYGPMHGCLAFLPKMKASQHAGVPGIIINTGSKQGITMPPGNLIYNMSKAALKTYTEGLEHELMLDRMVVGEKDKNNNNNLRAALLIPGWVNTSILLKAERAKAQAAADDKKDFDPSAVFFHEDKPQPGAWMPSQVIDFMLQELDKGRFYILCPDNDVNRETDNLRMTWTMQDITENRAPLSRWHPDYQEQFAEYLMAAQQQAAAAKKDDDKS